MFCAVQKAIFLPLPDKCIEMEDRGEKKGKDLAGKDALIGCHYCMVGL